MLKTKKFRRLLAGLLAVLMLSVCLPVGAFATGGEYTTISVTQKYTDGSTIANINVGTIPYEDGTILPDVGVLSAYFADTDSYTYTGTYDVSLNGAAANTYGPNSEKAYDYAMVKNATMDITIYYDKVEVKPADTTTITIAQKYTDGALIANINVGTIPYEDATTLPNVGVLSAYFSDTDSYTYTGTYDVSVNGAAANTYGPNSEKAYDLTMVKNATMDITIYYEKVEPATPSEDVNFRVEYVDENGQSLMAATNVATTYNDFEPSQKLADLLAKEIAEVEAEGYKQVAFTVVYEDGYETAPLNEPYVVPDYDGKTIKVYFAKVENYEDVNVRFEFVDMDGNTIQPATNYATSLSDSIVGPKVSEVLADEIDKLAADGYDFDHYAWVLADGTETVLTDPVVVPDYDGTTIKVYFVKVEEYEDVHVRFEFVDMDGNSVLPATNYATCLSDSVIGPKVNDVLADELSTMEGRNYNFHHYAWVYSDGTETELDNDVIVVPDHDGTTIKVYFEAVKTEPSDPSTGDNTTTVTGKDEHPDIAEAKANGTWGAPTATPAAASTIPQTGDSMPVVMLIVIALVAAGAAGGLVVLRKRSHQ